MAAFCLEDLIDLDLARDWLNRLDEHLLQVPDSDYAAEAQEFRRKLHKLEMKEGKRSGIFSMALRLCIESLAIPAKPPHREIGTPPAISP
jgi:hypothetical protein